MSEIMEVAYQRKISDVTRDIRIQTGQFLRTAIEIGRLLFEAKAMVEPGGWSRYIEEELPFSHSWANNYMKLYKEYGSDQTSLFGDSQAFMNLRPTQALELLALPAAEREEFAQTHDVADMSTRQLRQAIKDLEDTRKELEETDEALEAESEKREALEHELGEAKASAKTAWQEVKAAEQEAAAAKDKQFQAEKKLQKLEDQLRTAQKAEKTALEDLKKAKENPDIPESMMEQLRRDGVYTVPDTLLEKLRKEFWAGWSDDAKGSDVIAHQWKEHGYLCDTHTAAGFAAADEYIAATGDTRPMVVLSTASPYKFPAAVLSAIGGSLEGNEFDQMARLSQITGVPVPRQLATLQGKEEKHTGVIGKEEMLSYVLSL